MGINFPSSPAVGDLWPSPPIANVPVYTWDGEKWGSGSGYGAIYMSDTAPPNAPTGSLWFETDTGLLFVRFNDGTSIQWVIACPMPDVSDVVRFSTQTLTAEQQAQARTNVYAAPFDALAFNGIQVNGNFDVDQIYKGGVMTIPAGASSTHLMDGWWQTKRGSMAYTVQRALAFVQGYTAAFKLTITTAQPTINSGDLLDIRQSIEGWRSIARLWWGSTIGQPVTIAFWAKSSVAGTFMMNLYNSDYSRFTVGSFTITTPNVAQYITVTYPPPTVGGAGGAWYNDNNVGMVLVMRLAGEGANIASAVNNTFEMTGSLILPGIEVPNSVRAPLIMRDFITEEALCQRYLETCAGAGGRNGLAWSGYAQANTAQIASTTFRAIKRVTPTMTFADIINQTFNALPFAGVSPNTFGVEVERICTVTTAYAYFATAYTADARLM